MMEKVASSLSRCIEWMLMAIFVSLLIDVVWQVFSRYVIGQSSSFTEEFARFALIWLVVLGAAYLNGKQEHLTMDYLVNKLSPERRKIRMNIIEVMLFFFALVVMVIGGGNLVYTTLLLGQDSPAMGIPLGYVYSIVPVSGIIMMFYSLYHVFGNRKQVG